MLLLGLLASAVLTAPVLAAQDEASDDTPAISLRVSPAILEVPLRSGPARHEIRLDNRGSQPLTVTAEVAEFTVTEDGTTTFLGPTSCRPLVGPNSTPTRSSWHPDNAVTSY